jgi:hypothetical protein
MSGRERLMQALQGLPDADLEGLSDAALVRVLAFIKSEAQRPAVSLSEAQREGFKDLLAFASQELDAYNQDYSEFADRFK